MESNSAQWSALLNSLKELIQWCKTQQQEISHRKKNLQPDLNLIVKQINENKVFMCNVEYKKSIIESTLASAKLYYDDRLKSNEQLNNNIKEAAVHSNNNLNNTSKPNDAPSVNVNGSISGGLFNLKKRLSLRKSKKNKENSKEEAENGFNKNELCETSLNNDTINIQVIDYDEDSGDEHYVEPLDFFAAASSSQQQPSEIAALLVSKIDRKVQILDRLWQDLNRQSLAYNNILINFYQNFLLLNKSFEMCDQKINENEQLIAQEIGQVSEIESDKLAEELEKVKQFQLKVSSFQPLIDNMCTNYANIMQDLAHTNFLNKKESSQNVLIESSNLEHSRLVNSSSSIYAKFDDLNLRWTNLQNQLQETYLHIYSLIESSGADIFLKLSDSVQTPWQRGISANKVPYYIK